MLYALCLEHCAACPNPREETQKSKGVPIHGLGLHTLLQIAVCIDWQGLELAAQGEKRGLWVDSGHLPPWGFRRRREKLASPVVSFKAD